MKWMGTLLWIMLLLPAALPAQRKDKYVDSATVKVFLDNSHNNNAPVDSVLVIFDRYNLTGAGMVKKVYYPVKNELTIPNIPHGKYYMEFKCLGIYQQSFEQISYVYKHRKNNNTFRFRLDPAESFDPTAINIPAEKINWGKLSVLHPKVIR